ncbi:hypothetical protein [Coraliomargarita parva]|uniref:hypothetical protein n=1 Tax=Coraliomargarita parva TaxID=3014050 RepID=UPI0022B58C0A|nr:hypothetical protein [Coraliomargarita parva]
MSYIQKANDFWAVQAVTDTINAKEIALFFWLLNVANRLHWPLEFEPSAAKTCAALGITSRSTLARSRERLAEAGLIRFRINPTSKKCTYSLENCDTARAETATQPATPREDRQIETERETDVSGSTLSLSNFGELVEKAKEHFPNRADVEECAEAARDHYAAKGLKLTFAKLRAWIAGEKFAKFKPKPDPAKDLPEPQGWRQAFAEEYGREPEESFSVFAQKHPDLAKALREKCDGNCDTERDENRNGKDAA